MQLTHVNYLHSAVLASVCMQTDAWLGGCMYIYELSYAHVHCFVCVLFISNMLLQIKELMDGS